MEVFNYENDVNKVDKLLTLADRLSQKEAEAALNAIEEAKLINSAVVQENHIKWFNQTVLPILKDFAELNGAILQVENNDDICIITTIFSDGLDITETCKTMKWIIAFADHIGINVQNTQVALTLIFETP